MNTNNSWLERLQAARADLNGHAIQVLLAEARQYLLLIARAQWPQKLQAKESPSDLVQQSVTEAVHALPNFDGSSPEQWQAWLRSILMNNFSNLLKHYSRKKRNISREAPAGLGSASSPCPSLIDPEPTPLTHLLQSEGASQLQAALATLSDKHREIIFLRHHEKLSFKEIGSRLELTEDTAQKRWTRAIFALSQRIGNPHDA